MDFSVNCLPRDMHKSTSGAVEDVTMNISDDIPEETLKYDSRIRTETPASGETIDGDENIQNKTFNYIRPMTTGLRNNYDEIITTRPICKPEDHHKNIIVLESADSQNKSFIIRSPKPTPMCANIQVNSTVTRVQNQAPLAQR
ncbi:uncharacterized protein LOC143243676, partial [Tachypleus tridentatus]|uniref:uncharacterized protein LOC143243676 n=1 Tax=Tachypleus tridentatus TaxID=6853 RepID=UPI003FD686B2